MKEALKKYIRRYVVIEEEDFEKFCNYLEFHQFNPKEYLLKSGSICYCKYFILKGLTRTFYIEESGVERIIQFGIENWWVTDMDSFCNEVPSNVYIQALEPLETFSISKQSLEQVYTEIPIIERFFRRLTENWLIAQQKSSHFYMKANSKKRYLDLINSIPNFVQRVPQYMIASYLDITPEYLSDIRKTQQ
ncbi:MAG: Crp/Fnr family transcriptional regulator [Saprospiraceae bacterium]|nr:Crp/Fnr family transcriptional regulator [Saprospiraceae bacterium]